MHSHMSVKKWTLEISSTWIREPFSLGIKFVQWQIILNEAARNLFSVLHTPLSLPTEPRLIDTSAFSLTLLLSS
jgi:hypothetical protein